MSKTARPVVYLVGAGPGDPDLLTVKAYRLLQRADAVVYDRLVGDGILDLIPRGAARIYVGKANGQHLMRQPEINALLARLATPGRVTVRLKGGDPFVFGRGSEEAEYLIHRGIDVEVVPGITAASGCAAAAGIPLTHRGCATGVRFVTGHCREDKDLDLNWRSLADPDTTLVVYMGLANVDRIVAGLIGAGMPDNIAAAIIENGTKEGQRVIVTTLADLPERVHLNQVLSPAIFVIGHVAALAATVPQAAAGWFLPAGEVPAETYHA